MLSQGLSEQPVAAAKIQQSILWTQSQKIGNLIAQSRKIRLGYRRTVDRMSYLAEMIGRIGIRHPGFITGFPVQRLPPSLAVQALARRRIKRKPCGAIEGTLKGCYPLRKLRIDM